MSKKKLIFDISLALLLLLIGGAALLIINSKKDPGRVVEVKLKNQVIAEYSLFEDGEYVLNGGTNVLVIENGEAYMKSATCPGYPPSDRCTNQGRISSTFEKITCLPNELTVIVR